MKSITLITLIISSTVSAQQLSTFIQWKTNTDGSAVSSLGGTGLTRLEANTPSSNAQFLYDKLTTSTSPLVDVYLQNADTGNRVLLQSSFSMTAQQCSCYWLDAADLTKRFSQLSSGQKYRVVFKSQQAELASGYLGLVINSNKSETTTTSVTPITTSSATTSTQCSTTTSSSCSTNKPSPTTPCNTEPGAVPTETADIGKEDSTYANQNSRPNSAMVLSPILFYYCATVLLLL